MRTSYSYEGKSFILSQDVSLGNSSTKLRKGQEVRVVDVQFRRGTPEVSVPIEEVVEGKANDNLKGRFSCKIDVEGGIWIPADKVVGGLRNESWGVVPKGVDDGDGKWTVAVDNCDEMEQKDAAASKTLVLKGSAAFERAQPKLVRRRSLDLGEKVVAEGEKTINKTEYLLIEGGGLLDKSKVVQGHADHKSICSVWSKQWRKGSFHPKLLGWSDMVCIVGARDAPEFISDSLWAEFCSLVQAASEAGYDMMVNEGHRSWARQESLYSVYLAGGNVAAKPGLSNHQSGIAVDIEVQRGVSDLYWWLVRSSSSGIIPWVRTVKTECHHWELLGARARDGTNPFMHKGVDPGDAHRRAAKGRPWDRPGASDLPGLPNNLV